MNIEQYLSSQKKRVDEALSKFLFSDTACPPLLKKAMEYSLMAGGKRIRPILAIAASQAVGGVIEPVLPVACALEAIHTFSLIHDDLPAMDNDDFRRGRPTNHKVFGDGVAILAGDGLLAEAFLLLCHRDVRGTVDSQVLLDVIQDIAQATGSRGMVGGQILDLEAVGKNLKEDDLEKVHRCKTGSLVKTSVTSGARIGGASPNQLESLTIYGEKVGLAFQIADDILNVEGTYREMGKSIGSDQNNFKATYPKILGLALSKQRAQELTKQAIQTLRSFDEAADPLREIAEYIILRRS